MTPCILVGRYQRFGEGRGAFCLHLPVRKPTQCRNEEYRSVKMKCNVYSRILNALRVNSL
jgi:hypothetical protein